MQQCSNCGHQNRAGVVFCENCGASLIGKMPLDTKSLDSSTEEEKSQLGVDERIITDAKVQGIATFEEGTSLRLGIEGSTEVLTFKPKGETIFGRRDPATGAMPDIDLTPFAGYRMGVSRRHAAIRHAEGQTLALWDLGSSNGTFLNGQRLNAHRPYRLRDGDEIRLGQMVIHVYFDVAAETDKPAETVSEKIDTPEALPPSPKPEAKETAKPAESKAPEAEKSQPVEAPPIIKAGEGQASKTIKEPAKAAPEPEAKPPITEIIEDKKPEAPADVKTDSGPAETKDEKPVEAPPAAPVPPQSEAEKKEQPAPEAVSEKSTEAPPVSQAQPPAEEKDPAKPDKKEEKRD